MRGVLGHLAPVHRCAHSVCCVVCAGSLVTWLPFTGVPVRCVVLCMRCPCSPGSCSPVCPLGVFCCAFGVLGPLAPAHQGARSVCWVACAVCLATWLMFTGVPARCAVCAVLFELWLLFTGVPARCVVLRVRRFWPLGSRARVCPLGVLCCALGCPWPLAPVQWCACSVCCVVCAVYQATRLLFTWVPAGCPDCAVFLATWLLFTDVPAGCVVLCAQDPWLPGSRSQVCPFGVLCCVCGVLAHLAPVHRCACSVCCVVRMVSLAPWLLFTGVPARFVGLRVRCPWPPGSCLPVCLYGVLCVRCCSNSGSCLPVCPLGVLCCVCGVFGHLAPVHECARSVCCVVRWGVLGPWLPFSGAPARSVVLCVRCTRPLGCCSPGCPRRVLIALCRWPFASCSPVPARCVVLRVRDPWLLGSRSPVCPLAVLCCVCGVLGQLAPVHWCARWVCCFVCAVSLATCLLFTGVPSRCVLLCVWCPLPLGSCSPGCPLGVLGCVCGVLSHLALVYRCACAVCCVCSVVGTLASVNRCTSSECCVACAVSLATWLRSRVCLLGVLCCGLGCPWPLAPVHRCARSVFCVVCVVSQATRLLFIWVPARCPVCAVSLATWLLFTGVPAQCVVLCARDPWLLGSRSPVCPLGALCWVCGVLGQLTPVHRFARSVCSAVRSMSLAPWLPFTGVSARCVMLCVWRPWPLGSCSPVCPLGVLCCVRGVLGHLISVHRCACAVCCVRGVHGTWLLFTGVPARGVVLCLWCPWPLGSRSPVCPLVMLSRAFGVLRHLAPVHQCASSVCCVACAVALATWLLFIVVPARCAMCAVS